MAAEANALSVICRQCGTVFQRKPGHHARKFCEGCRPARAETPKTVPCMGCGEPILFGPRAKRCGPCKRRTRAADSMVTRECKSCGHSFTYDRGTERRPRVYCSSECRPSKGEQPVDPVPCLTCGEPYRPRYNAAGYCSIRCRRYPAAKKWESKAECYAHHRHKRRAQIKSRPHERFSRKSIYERDGWKCGICGKPVDPNAAYPSLMSASLDHITPLALGGAHTRSNVQCAHFICNSRKTHRGKGGQFKLAL